MFSASSVAQAAKEAVLRNRARHKIENAKPFTGVLLAGAIAVNAPGAPAILQI